MATFSPYLNISHHILLNSPPLILPRRFSDDMDARFDEHELQSNHVDSARLSSNAAPSLSGLGIRNLDFSKDLESKGYSQDIPVSHRQVCFDRRYSRRTPRVESTYDTLNETFESFMKPDVNPPSIPSTWSFSSVIKDAEFAADEAVHEMGSALSLDLGVGDPGTASMFLDMEDQISWTFEKFPTPRALVSDFITQLSASDPILKQVCLNSAPHAAQIHMGDGQTQVAYNFQEECSVVMPAATNLIPELSLPVDIDMRNANLNNSCIGVNPADILPALLSPPSLSNVPLYYSYPSDSLSTNEPTVDGEFFRQDNVTNMEYPECQAEVTYHVSCDVVLPASACADSKASKQESDNEHSVFHSPSSDYSPSLKSPVLKPTLSIKIKDNKRHRIVRTKSVESDFTYPETHDCHQGQGFNLPVNLGTPVLDAHRGIELEELKAKAERYRLRNQGRDYDKRWLISFAGKLSRRGELIEEFRCYITGCGQINKRRDHILIHVGAHLDQRPFKCRHWYVQSFTSSSFL